MGNWYYPNGTEVPRPSHYHSHNYRIGYTHQVRLTRKKDVLGPLGRYTCSIPDPQGRIWSASIFLVGMAYDVLSGTLLWHILKLRVIKSIPSFGGYAVYEQIKALYNPFITHIERL